MTGITLTVREIITVASPADGSEWLEAHLTSEGEVIADCRLPVARLPLGVRVGDAIELQARFKDE
jgi:hypothetical protein